MQITSFLFEREGEFLTQQMSADEFAEKFGFAFPVNEYTVKHEKENRVSFSNQEAAILWLVRNGMWLGMDEDAWVRLIDYINAGYKEE